MAQFHIKHRLHFFIMPPFEKRGAYSVAHVGLSVGRSVGLSVGRSPIACATDNWRTLYLINFKLGMYTALDQ